MSVKIRSVGDVQILELSGELAIGGKRVAHALDLRGRRLEDLGDILSEQLERGHRKIILDMRALKFIDSGGIGQLVVCKKRAVDRGGDVKLFQPTDRVLDVLQLTQLTKVFEIHQDENRAIESF